MADDAIPLRRTAPPADHRQIEQVLANLVVNARDAMGCGGSFVVEMGVVSRGSGAPQTWARLAATDTGTGMTPEQVARIYACAYPFTLLNRRSPLPLRQEATW